MFTFKGETSDIIITSRSEDSVTFECEKFFSKGVHDSRRITVPVYVDSVSKSEFFCLAYGSCYAKGNTDSGVHDDSSANLPVPPERIHTMLLLGKAPKSEIIRFSREHALDVSKFDEGSKSIQALLKDGKRNLFSHFYADREILKGMAAQLGIFRDWDDERISDDSMRDIVIHEIEALNPARNFEADLHVKALDNSYQNMLWNIISLSLNLAELVPN